MSNTVLQTNDRLLFEGDSLTEGLKNNCGCLMGWDKTWAHRVDEETRAVLARAEPYWQAGREVIAAHGGVYVDAGAYMQPRAEALHQPWAHHTVYSSGVHYNAIGNELIAGAVLAQL